MSTVIDNAYKMPKMKSMADFFAFIEGDFRTELVKTRNFLYAKDVLSSYIELLDERSFELNPLGYNVGDEDFNDVVLSKLSQRITHSSVVRGGALDFSFHKFEASIGYDAVNDEVLILTNNIGIEYKNTLIHTLGLAEWDYTDQVDKPDEISDGEWKERELSWERVLKDGDTIEEMLLFRLSNERFSYIRLEDVVECIKTIKDNKSTFFPADILRKAWDSQYPQHHRRSEKIAEILLAQKAREKNGGFAWYAKHLGKPHFKKVIHQLAQGIQPYLPSYPLEELGTIDLSIHTTMPTDKRQEVYQITQDVYEKHLASL